MASETKCACGEAPRLIFACSGASDLGTNFRLSCADS